MNKRLFKYSIVIALAIIITYLCINSIKNTKSSTSMAGEENVFNTDYFKNTYTSPPTYSSLTVGEWYYFPITSGGTPHAAYKLDSSHILLISGNGLTAPQNISLFYYSVSGSTATLQKNATLTINGNPYATDASGHVYPTSGNHYTTLGKYNINLVAKDDLSGASNSYILKQREWAKGTSWWRYYDGWGLNSADAYAGFAISNTPPSLTSLAEGAYTSNGVTRTINKILPGETNTSVQDHPFTVDISSGTSYKFWYGSNHTQINESYIYDLGGRHVIWAEFNNKVDPPQSGQSAKYTSGNVGADIYNVGSYIVYDQVTKKNKRVKVNMRITFFWQAQSSSPVISYNAGGYTFNTYPSVMGVGIYPGTTNAIGFLMYGFPYRAHIDFFYTENGIENSLTLSGCIGFQDIDAGQYLGLKVNSGATIDELQCIKNTYSWTGTNNDTGKGSINYLALGRAASDGSGSYDVIGTNIYQNAELITPRPGTLTTSHPNYGSIASNDGLESMATYSIKNCSSLDLIVGGSKKSEAGIKYFNNIFDVPNSYTQLKPGVDTVFINEYAMADNTRDALGSNAQVDYGAIVIRGVKIGRNTIPSPTIMLKDADEDESSEITVDKAANSPNLSNYTEVISVKVPYEGKITTGSLPFDNYYDSFRINQTVNSNVQIGSVSIHYYGETTSLNSYFTIVTNNTSHSLIVQANAAGTPIYKTDAFYSNELIVEVELSLPSASSSVWDGTTTAFSHTASITVTRNNTEFSGVANETVTNSAPTAAIANVNKVTANIKRNDVGWESSEMIVALYLNGTQKYGYNEGTLVNNGSAIRWIGLKEGTYNIYASKDSDHASELVDSGTSVTVPVSQ